MEYNSLKQEANAGDSVKNRRFGLELQMQLNNMETISGPKINTIALSVLHSI